MRPVLALAATDRTMWIVSLVLGLVVLGVVVALLTWLTRIVQRIDAGVRSVWESATRVAANTATTWQLSTTLASVEELAVELQRHGDVLQQRR